MQAVTNTKVVGVPSGLYSAPEDPNEEHVVAAAIGCDDGVIYLGDCHGEARGCAIAFGIPYEEATRFAEGFWTSKERFITRTAAKHLAQDAYQKLRPLGLGTSYLDSCEIAPLKESATDLGAQAHRLVSQVWLLMDKSSRYIVREIMLVLDNDQVLDKDKEGIVKQYAASHGVSEEDAIDALDSAINADVVARDEARQNRVNKKLTPGDPLAHIKQLLAGKDWPAARRAFVRDHPMVLSGGINRPVDDTLMNELWRTDYNAATGGRYNTPETRENPTVEDVGKMGPDSKHSWEYMYLKRALVTPGDWGGLIQVYRGVPRGNTTIRPGDYATTNRDYARGYSHGKYATVLSDKLPTRDLRVDPNGSSSGATHLIYAPSGAESGEFRAEQPPFTLHDLWAKVNGVTEGRYSTAQARSAKYNVATASVVGKPSNSGLFQVPKDPSVEHLIAAAVRDPDGEVTLGDYHEGACENTKYYTRGYLSADIPELEDGFWTSRGRFVTRAKGMQILRASGFNSLRKLESASKICN